MKIENSVTQFVINRSGKYVDGKMIDCVQEHDT